MEGLLLVQLAINGRQEALVLSATAPASTAAQHWPRQTAQCPAPAVPEAGEVRPRMPPAIPASLQPRLLALTESQPHLLQSMGVSQPKQQLLAVAGRHLLRSICGSA